MRRAHVPVRFRFQPRIAGVFGTGLQGILFNVARSRPDGLCFSGAASYLIRAVVAANGERA